MLKQGSLYHDLQVVHQDGSEGSLRVPQKWMEKQEALMGKKLSPRMDMLVVLNPIGTLVYISEHKGQIIFIRRPYMDNLIEYLLDHMYLMFWFPTVSERIVSMVVDQLLGVRKLELEAIWDYSSCPETATNLIEGDDVAEDITKCLDIEHVGLEPVWQRVRGGRRWTRQNTILLSTSKAPTYRSAVSFQLQAKLMREEQIRRRKASLMSLDSKGTSAEESGEALPFTSPSAMDNTSPITAPSHAVVNMWKQSHEGEHDLEMLDLKTYFHRACHARFGPSHFFKMNPYDCGWKGLNDRPKFGRQTEKSRRSVADV
jgi:hypothetical protein